MKVYLFGHLRSLSYDRDWLDAFRGKYDAEFHPLSEPKPEGQPDMVVLLHSATAQGWPIPEWVYDYRCQAAILTGNDYKLFGYKQAIADRLRAKIFTLAPNMPYRQYEHLPHALNPARFVPAIPYKDRPFQFGFRGIKYPDVGDIERNTIVALFQHKPHCSVEWGIFQNPDDYITFLNLCKATPATEAGLAGAKAVSSRHFDAIGCKTALVMYSGEFSGCLSPEHYIELKRDHSNLQDCIARVNDEQEWEAVTSRALAHVMKHHTYAQRIEQFHEAMCL